MSADENIELALHALEVAFEGLTKMMQETDKQMSERALGRPISASLTGVSGRLNFYNTTPRRAGRLNFYNTTPRRAGECFRLEAYLTRLFQPQRLRTDGRVAVHRYGGPAFVCNYNTLETAMDVRGFRIVPAGDKLFVEVSAVMDLPAGAEVWIEGIAAVSNPEEKGTIDVTAPPKVTAIEASYAALPYASSSTEPAKKPEKVTCVACGQEEERRHPGHFLCGNPRCRHIVSEILKPADRAFRFLCGLNLQDHSTKEQRELLDIVHQMRRALRPDEAEIEKTEKKRK